MAAETDASPPLLPVVPEYASWVDNARGDAQANAARADATFAARHGPLSGPEPAPRPTPEQPRGALADEKA